MLSLQGEYSRSSEKKAFLKYKSAAHSFALKTWPEVMRGHLSFISILPIVNSHMFFPCGNINAFDYRVLFITGTSCYVTEAIPYVSY